MQQIRTIHAYEYDARNGVIIVRWKRQFLDLDEAASVWRTFQKGEYTIEDVAAERSNLESMRDLALSNAEALNVAITSLDQAVSTRPGG